MSVSREWTSLKIAWVILLMALIARIFLSSQFLLTPDEAFYWYNSKFPTPDNNHLSPIISWSIQFATTLFGNNEIAVRLPAILCLTLAAIYMALLAASMFSWHTGFHVTLLAHGILQLNMAALVISPYSFLIPCWAAVCYHSSQAMHSNSTGGWLLAGFWFGIGLLCNFSMFLLLPCLMLCFIFIKPFRTCLLFPGPWFGFILSLAIFLPVAFFQEVPGLLTFIKTVNFVNLIHDLIPDIQYSLQFLVDQAVLVTPVVLLLILACWLTGANKRHLVKPDVQFLVFTSLPVFIVYLIFPVFDDLGNTWSAVAYISAFALIAGIHSSTRSSFKGRPNLRWIIGIITAYCITIPLILYIAYPALPLPLHLYQTRLATSGWDLLGQATGNSFHQMPNPDNTFIFSMEPKIASELAFYVPGNIKTVSLDHEVRTRNQDFLVKDLKLVGQDGLGLVSTRAALEQAKFLFESIDLEREITLTMHRSGAKDQPRTFFMIRGFNYSPSIP